MAIVLLLGGLFVGFPEGEANKVVSALFALIGSVGALRVFFKNAELRPIEWIQNTNTWNYISTIFIALFPVLTPEIFQSVRAVIEQAMGGNWQGIFTALISLGTIIWNIFKKTQLPKQVATVAVLFFFAFNSVSAQSNRSLRNDYKRNIKELSKDT